MTSAWLLLAVLCGPAPASGDALSCANAGAAWSGNIGPVAPARDAVFAADGGLLLTGQFWCSDLDPTDGADEYESGVHGQSAYVVRVSASGAYDWAYVASGLGIADAGGIDERSDGTIVVAGMYSETIDFDPTEGVDERTSVGEWNSFVVQLAPDGTYLDVIAFGEGDDYVSVSTSALDSGGNLLLVGAFHGTADFDPGAETDVHTAAGHDVFVTKLAADGSYLWTRTFGGPWFNRGTGVAVDLNDDILLTGTFRGVVDFDPTEGVDEHFMLAPYEDHFITKLHPDGSYAWTRTYDVGIPASVTPITVGPDGGAVIAGGFKGTIDFDTTDGVDVHSTGTQEYGDIFATKVNKDGSYGWTYTAGGQANDIGMAAAVDAAGNVFVTGQFDETVDFDPGPGVDLFICDADIDPFVTMLRSDGGYVWTRQIADVEDAWGKIIAIDPSGGIAALGICRPGPGGMDLDPGCGVDIAYAHFDGGTDTYIVKLACIDSSPDFDDDGDVDLRDLARFQACFTGEGWVDCGDGCPSLDLDADDDIDLSDFAWFSIELDSSGP